MVIVLPLSLIFLKVLVLASFGLTLGDNTIESITVKSMQSVYVSDANSMLSGWT